MVAGCTARCMGFWSRSQSLPSGKKGNANGEPKSRQLAHRKSDDTGQVNVGECIFQRFGSTLPLESDRPMIEKINLYNFRCFKSLELAALKRINLIVGENSSGKSAFLESIFISSGSLAPQVVFQMRSLRKMGNQVVLPTDAQTYRGLWEDLFFDFALDKKVSIKILGSPASDGRSLIVEFSGRSGTPELPFDGALPAKTSRQQEQLTGLPQIEF